MPVDHAGDLSFFELWDRTYSIPPPPQIPNPPGSTSTPSEPPGYSGPRLYTLVRGDDWNGLLAGTSVLIPYSFATRASYNYGSSRSPFEGGTAEPLDATQRAHIREALNHWERIAGLVFVEIPDPVEAEFGGIRFMLENTSEEVSGFALPNSGPYGFSINFNRVHWAEATFEPGSRVFRTALHEVGHAIGLKHPHDGSPLLSTSEDNGDNTIMSYNFAGKYANFSKLGPFDIAAAQYIYGTNEAEAAAAIRWAHGPDGSLITAGSDQPNSIAGFGNRDVVHAGGGSDFIAVQGGNDVVATGAGNDVVFGGGGTDTLRTGVLRRQAVVAVGPDQGTVAQHDGMDTYYEVEILRFTDGDLHVSGQTAAGQAFRLYGAALGRAPDALGLSAWVGALQAGAISLTDAAAGFANSAEFAARYGALDNAGFVTLLYANVLGRAPDAVGMNYWTTVLHDPAINRVSVLLGFSESLEYQRKTATAFTGTGMWVADPEAADVLRAYVAVLDRLPDGGGLAAWTAAREAGLGQAELVARFVQSAEFQDRFGGLSNQQFVEQLYRTALDREADAGGAAAWTGVLDAGIDTRAGVAFGFAARTELTIKVTPMVENGLLFL